MDTSRYKKLLEEEKKRIERELSHIARRNPDNPSDWEPKGDDMGVLHADKNELADTIEEYEVRAGVEENLEERLRNIEKALSRIADGTYGICAIGGEPIEEDRLEANPAAKTCKKHINEKV